MSLSSPANTPDTSLELHDDDTTLNRRKSGRVRSKPTLLLQESSLLQSNGVKRKRTDLRGDEREDLSEDELEGRSSPVEESGPDEEELRQARRKARKPAAKKSKKSATTTLAMRPIVNGLEKPAKAQKSRAKTAATPDDGATGLFGISSNRYVNPTHMLTRNFSRSLLARSQT